MKADKARARNKETLFALLETLGVTQISVQFDGYGDSGQIEHVEVHSGDSVVEFPDPTVRFTRIDGDGSAVEQSLEDALDSR